MQDSNVTKHIESLVNEEHRLFGKQDMRPEESARLKAVQVELDRCWDLLRQRRAKREFGENPNEAQVRGADVVEKYEQ
jgi:Protein of unknown function (DUF2630)